MLKRLFGDAVYDLFPESLQESVDKAYEFWKTHPDDYLVTDFETEQEKADCLGLMRAYAEVAGKDGYTITTDKDAPPLELWWRARDKIRRPRAE